MPKNLIVLVVLITSFLFYTNIAFAADKNVVCNSDGCSGFEGSLFSEMDLKPGDTYEKNICITNDRTETLAIEMSLNEDPGGDTIFKQVLEVIMKDDTGNILFQGSLKDFLSSKTNLGKIKRDETECYQISVHFPKDSGNIYQENQITFDLSLRITGEETGTTNVLSSSTTSCENCETSTDIKSIIGEVLGLSDTSGELLMKRMGFLIFGILFTIIGIKTTLQKGKAVE